MLLGTGSQKTTMPFGPFMILGSAMGVVFGKNLGRLYSLLPI